MQHNFNAKNYKESAIFFASIKLCLKVRIFGKDSDMAKDAFTELRRNAAKLLESK